MIYLGLLVIIILLLVLWGWNKLDLRGSAWQRERIAVANRYPLNPTMEQLREKMALDDAIDRKYGKGIYQK